MKPGFFGSHATSKTFKIFCLYSQRHLNFMENPIIRIAAKFQYKIRITTAPCCYGRYLMVSRSSARKELYFPTILKPESRSWCEYFPPPQLEKLVLKTVQWNVIIKIIVIVVVVVQLRWVLLQTATGITRCGDYYKVRQNSHSSK